MSRDLKKEEEEAIWRTIITWTVFLLAGGALAFVVERFYA